MEKEEEDEKALISAAIVSGTCTPSSCARRSYTEAISVYLDLEREVLTRTVHASMMHGVIVSAGG